MLTAATGQSEATNEGPVVVCGAGAAGLSAAIAAARGGSDVLLVEADAQPGGTVANALIHTLGGLFDSDGELLNDGLPRELMERLARADASVRKRKMGRVWVLQVCPNLYRRTITQWIGEEKRIKTLYDSKPVTVARSEIDLFEIEIAGAAGVARLRPRAVVDATGSAEVARLVDPQCVLDSERRAAGGWIFRLRNVSSNALESTKGLAVVRALREAAVAGTLPVECRQAWIDHGIHADEVFVKLFVPLSQRGSEGDCFKAIQRRAEATQAAVVEFLRRLPDFSQASVTETGCLGVRDGGRIRGRCVLSVDDVREGRSFDDGVCRCAWPIELWDPEQGLSIEYLRPGTSYQIPMRSLQLEGVRNFWVAGKCLSADRFAHASARVAGTCWAMGQAAGMAAAAWKFDKLDEHHEPKPVRPVSSACAATA